MAGGGAKSVTTIPTRTWVVNRVVATGVAALVLAASAVADVPESRVKAGSYSGKTSQGRVLSFSYAAHALNKLMIGWRVDCPKTLEYVANTTTWRHWHLRGGHYTRIILDPAYTVPFTFSDGTRGTDKKRFHIVIHFPDDRHAAGTIRLTVRLFNAAGTQVDTCTMKTKTTFTATHV
jgi:hypothetical protein